MEGKNSVSIKSFSKRYGMSRAFACKNVDFEASCGEITGILGLNGAGKSTLLKAICGIHLPTSGSVEVCGATTPTQIRRVTGYVPETPDLDKAMTVRECLFFEAACHGLAAEEAHKRVSEAIEISHIEDVLDKKTGSLSKGYLQRVSLALALCFEPKVLVLDEFTGGLDPEQISRTRKAVKNLSKSKAIILSTHNIDEAQALCARIYIMHRGEVAASGGIGDIIAKTGGRTLEEAFLSLTSGEE